MDVIEQLHRSLDMRVNPEAICGMILNVPGTGLMPAQRRILERAANSRPGRYSSMSDDFERPVPAEHKVRTLLTLLEGKELAGDVVARMAGDPWLLRGQLRVMATFLGWNPSADLDGRPDRNTVVAAYRLSRRRHNRVVRQMRRTEERAIRLQQQILLRQMTMVGRSGLAYSITLDEMRADPAAACFVAYWVAQRNRRRAFTLAGRDNPFDQIAEILLAQCQARGDQTDWWMVARAYPQPVVVARLNDTDRGALMGRWSTFMRLGADLLHDAYELWPTRDVEPLVPDQMWESHPDLMPPPEKRGARTEKVVDRQTMIVAKGVDSSTWNTVAQAYNAARSGWMNCLGASGSLDLLRYMCPGKAMRLMAADLAYMHTAHGSSLDPETQVWAELPPPWEVLGGVSLLGADSVETVCEQYSVDPHAKGWTAPRQVAGDVAEWKPTPELVHGIELADPLWAGLLRRSGAFSGKTKMTKAVAYP